MPMLISSVVSNVVNGVLGYYLVHCTEYGWIGAAVARSVGNVVLVPCVIVGMGFGLGEKKRTGDGGDYETIVQVDEEGLREDDGEIENKNSQEFLHHLWEGFVIKDALSFKAIIEFLDLGIPGALQIMFEW